MAASKKGVLAIQGSYAAHAAMLRALGCEPVLVRKAEHLEDLSHLVIPGGESTVLSQFLDSGGLGQRICAAVRAGALSVFGTCAGAILCGGEPSDGPIGCGRQPVRLELAPVEVARNAYGRQIDSFTAPLALVGVGDDQTPFEGVFIRAPRFGLCGDSVVVLGRYGEEPVLVRCGNVLLSAFHPELTDDVRIHRYFIEHM